MPFKGLIDSNIIVAALVEDHEHHGPSAAILIDTTWRWSVAGHSYAEAYVTLTRAGGRLRYQWSPERVRAALDRIGEITDLVGLSPAQTRDAIRGFAQLGGTGASVYDWLIGRAAKQAGCKGIVTWNVRHFAPLFPDLRVQTPSDLLADAARA